MNLFNRINEHRYLYLTELSEPEDNVLRLIVTEGRTGDEAGAPAGDEVAETMSKSSPILADGSAAYELIFDQYIAYAVLNESFTVRDDAEKFEGKLFRIYSESKFLSYVSAGTIATADYPGSYKHYGLVCLNHVVEIASTADPVITMLRSCS
jgi:hypothetical protein